MDFDNFRHEFVGECQRLDIPHENFASILARTHGKFPHFRKLKTREWGGLHGLYLKALSDALRQKATDAVRLPEA